MFQSPSLRGSGRFWFLDYSLETSSRSFNPLHCGAVVASRIAGRRCVRCMSFQSPSLRGSGRFMTRFKRSWSKWRFQSPSLRGSGRFGDHASVRHDGRTRFNPLHCGAVVASGARVARPDRSRRRFNPLHCGAVVASIWGSWVYITQLVVSIPFIAGQWSLLPRTTPSSLFGVLLRKRRLPCDHIICTRLPF